MGRAALAGYLFERDSTAQWVRIVPGAVKVPDAQIIPTVVDPRFPVSRVVLYDDTTTVPGVQTGQAIPEPSPVTAAIPPCGWRDRTRSACCAGTALAMTSGLAMPISFAIAIAVRG